MGTSSPHSSHGRPQPGAEPQITARAGIFLGLPVGIVDAPRAGHISPALCAGLWALMWVRGSLILQQLGMLRLDPGTRGLGFSVGRKLDALAAASVGGRRAQRGFSPPQKHIIPGVVGAWGESIPGNHPRVPDAIPSAAASLGLFVPHRLALCIQQEVVLCLWVVVFAFFFFPFCLPRGRKRSVLGDEVLATIYVERFAIFHASPGSGIFIV